MCKNDFTLQKEVLDLKAHDILTGVKKELFLKKKTSRNKLKIMQMYST